MKRIDQKAIMLSLISPMCILIITLYLCYNIYQNQIKHVNELFELRQEKVTVELSDILDSYKQLLRGSSALFEATENLTRDEWKTYVENLELDKHYPGVRALAYGKIIPAANKQEYIETTRSEGFNDFKIFPDGQRDKYIPATYLEPFNEENKLVHGYDMWSEQKRRETMTKALETGEIAISYKLDYRLNEQKIAENPGFMMFIPLYEKGTSQKTIQDRYKNIIGYFYGVFDTKIILDTHVLGMLSNNKIQLKIYDENDNQQNLIYNSNLDSPESPDKFHTAPMQSTVNKAFANHVWLLKYSTQPSFGLNIANKNKIGFTLVIGIVFSFMVYVTLWSLLNARRQSELVAQKIRKEYQETQDRLQLTFEATKAGIFDWDIVNDKLYWSGLVLENLGLSQGDINNKPIDFFERLHPEDKDHVEKLVQQHFKNKSEFNTEYRLRHKDGSYRWFDAKGQAVWEDEEPVRMAGTMVDISNTTVLTNNLEVLERLTNTGTWRVDLTKGEALWSNETFAIHGVSSSEKEPSLEKCFEFYLPEYRQYIEDAVNDAIQKGHDFKFDAKIRSKNSVIKHVLSIGYCEKDDQGNTVSLWGTIQDISELKKGQEKTELMALVANNTSDAVIITGKDRIIEWVNPSFEKLTGYRLDEAQGKSPGKLLQGKKTSKKTIEEFSNALNKGQSITKEILNYSKDGTEYWLNMTINPIFDASGDIIKFVSIERDITRDKEIEKELNDYRQNLENLVDEQTKNLIVEKENAEKANSVKDDFLANMSHELRTPLNSIMGLTSLMINDENAPKDHLESLSIVHQASDILLKTVNDILDISKIEAAHFQLVEDPFNLYQILQQTVQQLKPLASQKGLTLSEKINVSEDVNIIGDDIRFSRVLTNVISNAIKYTENGNVDLKFVIIPKSSRKILFQANIKDTGIGIPANMLEKIFDKFTQTEAATHKKFSGTGLGLNITKQLVEMMGGKISVESKLESGSEFKISIPFETSKKDTKIDINDAKMRHINDLARTTFQDAKILIAEDHAFNQVFIQKLFKQYGCNNYKIVENGKQVLTALNKDEYDIILMDCHMPEMSGYEATESIRSRGNTIPIVAMTADAMVGTKDQCIAIGMDDYVSKPIDSEKLIKVIERWFIFDTSKTKDRSRNQADEHYKNSASSPVELSMLIEYAGEDSEDLKELISYFLKKSNEDIQSLKKQITSGENKEWCLIAHGLKGSSSYIGAETLRLLCEEAQNMKVATKKSRQELFTKIKNEHTRVCEHLNLQNF